MREQYKRTVLILISVATFVRLFFASQLELGNDEVYYWTYALYPDWSHFDHPPMVGIVAQLFSLDLLLKDDFFLRLGPIVLSTASTWIIFLIGTKIKNAKSGLYAAFLFTGSIYCSIISGFSLTPDAPLVFFWLLAMNLMIDFLPKGKITSRERKRILFFGLIAGLAMLSKYQGAFLWIAVFIYVGLYNRQWLKEYSFYVAGMISAIALLPLVIWNLQNEFISFTFHTARVAPAWEFRPDYFLTEILGQVAYNNPVNYVLIVIALIAFFKRKTLIEYQYARILFAVAIPLWVVFTGFSLFRSTLPHWTAPAFLPMILFAAIFWSEQPEKKFFWIKFPSFFLASLLVIALWLIDYSPLQLGKKSDISNFGEDDFTQDLYGWDQVANAFKKIVEREEKNGTMSKQVGIISFKWFPAAHIDFYIAQPEHKKLFMMGEMNDLHKYAWINKYRGGPQRGNDYFHIAVSNVYKDPNELFGNYFEKIERIDTVEIKRGGKIMRYAFFYRLKNYNGNFVNPLP
ncbi:MAG: glycosyltransferase family 39 protein [Bacteroidetes bacterium]|nr:glycosyltransferase family 39 protein [Bacteroidota bacterium]